MTLKENVEHWALKQLDAKLAGTVDNVAKKFFGRTRTEALDTHTCISCGKPAIDFKDDKSAAEWRISGLCQKCQDSVFEED